MGSRGIQGKGEMPGCQPVRVGIGDEPVGVTVPPVTLFHSSHHEELQLFFFFKYHVSVQDALSFSGARS